MDNPADQATGVGIVRRSMSEPLRWIAENAGEQGYVVVSKVADLPVGQGLNAATGEYEDLVKADIIDAALVSGAGSLVSSPSRLSTASMACRRPC